MSIAACSAADTAPPPVTVPAVVSVGSPVATVAPPASAAPAVPEGVCSRLLAHNRGVMAITEMNPPGSDAVSFAESCFPTPKGAWGLRLDRWENKEEPGSGMTNFTFQGSFTVVHLPDEAAATSYPAGFQVIEQGFVTTSILPPLFFDHDADGEPELFLVIGTHVHEDAGRTQSALFTWKNGAVKPYPGLPAGVELSQDIDKDGRPDFLYYPYSEVRESPCSGFGFRWDGPPLVAHSLPGGGFSLDDKVAREHLLSACPPPKGKLKPARGENCDYCPGQDCNLCPNNEHPPEVCARLHGASEKQARAVLKGICKAPARAEEACQPPRGVCGDYPDREAVLTKIVPSPAAAGSGGANNAQKRGP
jgi:hypothetical protein